MNTDEQSESPLDHLGACHVLIAYFVHQRGGRFEVEVKKLNAFIDLGLLLVSEGGPDMPLTLTLEKSQ
jgi:hypothetical protein